MKWSISVIAEGDRVMSIEEIVELADAVAPHSGIASGIGTMTYGAQMIVEAPSADQAVNIAVSLFVRAAETAGLPPWPVTGAEAIGEEEELDGAG